MSSIWFPQTHHSASVLRLLRKLTFLPCLSSIAPDLALSTLLQTSSEAHSRWVFCERMGGRRGPFDVQEVRAAEEAEKVSDSNARLVPSSDSNERLKIPCLA